MQIKKLQAYSQLSTLQQTVKYFTHPLLVLLGLKLLAFKQDLLCIIVLYLGMLSKRLSTKITHNFLEIISFYRNKTYPCLIRLNKK